MGTTTSPSAWCALDPYFPTGASRARGSGAFHLSGGRIVFIVTHFFMKSLEVRNARQYVTNYPALARALGSERTQPDRGELALLADAAEGRRYHAGSMSTDDMFFMTALVSIPQPRQALEIGTASGASAALVARATGRGYEERGEELPEILLHTIDRKDRCLFDETQPIGFLVAQIAPELADRVKIHTLGDSSMAASFFGPKELSFAFIDGNHQHPWPLIVAPGTEAVILAP